jgi:hypothetical protein
VDLVIRGARQRHPPLGLVERLVAAQRVDPTAVDARVVLGERVVQVAARLELVRFGAGA